MDRLRFDCKFAYPSGFSLDFAFQATSPITALLGPSGIGKTTTLHLIAGLLKPARGQIVFDEIVLCDTHKRTCLPPEARRIGLVFQDYQLFPHLTVESNLRYGLRRSANAAVVDFAHLVEVLKLGALLRRYPNTLSGGQRQRVALGRALAAGPKLLLLDEPVSALDASLKANVLTYLQRVLDEYQIPTIVVTHDVDSAIRLGADIVQVPAPSGVATTPGRPGG